jgi:hypothetical protein
LPSCISRPPKRFNHETHERELRISFMLFYGQSLR